MEFIERLKENPTEARRVLVCTFFANILALATPLYVIQVLNRYVSFGVDSTLFTLSFGVLVAVAFELFFRMIRARLIADINEPYESKHSNTIFGSLSHTKLTDIERCSIGMREKLLSDVESIKQTHSGENFGSILDLPFSILFLVVIALISVPLAIVCICGICALLLLTSANMRLTQKSLPDISKAKMAKTNLSNSVINEPAFVRAFNNSGYLDKCWDQLTQKHTDLAAKLDVSQQFLRNLVASIIAIVTVFIIAIGSKQVVLGELSVGGLIGINILASRALAAFSKLQSYTMARVAAIQAKKRLQQFDSLPVEKKEGKQLSQFEGNVSLRDVAYSYPGAPAPLFETVNLEVKAEKLHVIVGPVASGKTTLLNIFVDLLQPTRGQLFIDGVDIRQLSTNWWRKQISYSPQRASFINGTILSNIMFANPEINNARLNELIRLVDLRDYLQKTKDWVEEPVVNEGRNLSGGIQRRLSLARALSTEGKLVILDEPTEGMDPKGQAMIYNLLNYLREQKKTLIISTYDQKIIEMADVVIDLTEKPHPTITIKEGE